MKTQQPKLQIHKVDAEVIHLWRTPPIAAEIIEETNWDSLNPTHFSILNQSPCVTWILDISTREFIFISDNISDLSGYEVDNYQKHGLKFHESLMHQEDLKVIRRLILQIWKILNETPVSKRAGCKFSFDYRIVNSSGKEIRILEQNTVLQQDKNGKVTQLMGVCTDITHWTKNDIPQGLLISIHDQKCFFVNERNPTINKSTTILSKRELEIAKLMAEGRSSKFIADKLFISFHTVNTHRKNMMGKTKCKSTVGFVQFLTVNGLI